MGLKESGLRGSLRNVSVGIDAIPDSEVTRPADDVSFDTSDKYGLVFGVDSEWPSIGATISSQTSGATRAELYQESDASLLGSVDISSLGSDDSFTFDGVDLQPGDYRIVLDAEGASWTNGNVTEENISFPISSSDNEITLTDGAFKTTDTTGRGYAVVTIGNVGFD